MKEEFDLAFNHVLEDLRQPTRDLRAAIPEASAGFRDLHDAAMADGVLLGRIKEVIALAIAVTEGCDGCMAYDARAAVLKGASETEVAEALGVALLMAGGPVSVNGPRALQAFREFSGTLSASAVGA